MASLYDFSETKLGGGEVSMADFKGKPTVIVNVASL
jgi:glutathione peroxidase-family protein